MKYALIKDGNVQNIILWDGEGEYDLEDEVEMRELHPEACIGWSYADGVWSPPPPAEEEPPPAEDPEVVQAKQDALQSLINLGVPESSARTIVGLPPVE